MKKQGTVSEAVRSLSGRISTPAHSPIHLLWLALAMALVSALLAGCGGGDEELGFLGAPALQRSAEQAPNEAPAAEPGR